ncbi:uncharacterized protein LOC126811233 [Patella vulgata]|uniref:uncharacterized protein LOC126811233 n=1 Tax=Patella vulgata TaxID=6465 RepID=UPI0024A9E95F|nr:uncharacterized protein LOC126811233 [Patella vulgata]
MFLRKWISGTKNRSVIVGCSVELVWKLHIQKNDVSIYKVAANERGISGGSKKYQIKGRQTEKIILTIKNAAKTDDGVYRCRINFTDEFADLHLSVKDFQWVDSSPAEKLYVGDDVTMTWKYVTDYYDKNISVYRRVSSITQTERLGKWEHDILRYTRDDRRLGFYKTAIENGDTEKVMLAIHNTTVDDFKYTYNIKIDFTQTCTKHAQSIKLLEAPRVYTSTPEIRGDLSDDIYFVWYYKYSHLPTTINITRYNMSNKEMQNMRYWHKNQDIIMVDFRKRLLFSKTITNASQSIQGEINLTLLKTIPSDYDLTYVCYLAFDDYELGSAKVYLKLKDEEPKEIGTWTTSGYFKNTVSATPLGSTGLLMKILFILLPSLFLFVTVLLFGYVYIRYRRTQHTRHEQSTTNNRAETLYEEPYEFHNSDNTAEHVTRPRSSENEEFSFESTNIDDRSESILEQTNSSQSSSDTDADGYLKLTIRKKAGHVRNDSFNHPVTSISQDEDQTIYLTPVHLSPLD